MALRSKVTRGRNRENHPDRLYKASRSFASSLDHRSAGELSGEETPWLKLIEPAGPGRPGIGIHQPLGDPRRFARFQFALKSVRQNPAPAPASEAASAFAGAYWSRLFSGMAAGTALTLLHDGGRDPAGQIRYRCLLEGESAADDLDHAVQQATDLIEDLLLAIPAAAAEYRFEPVAVPGFPADPAAYRVRVVPRGIRVSLRMARAIGYTSEDSGAGESSCLLGLPGPPAPLVLSTPLVAAQHGSAPIGIRIALRPLRLSSEQVEDAAEALKVLTSDETRMRHEPSQRSFGALPARTLGAIAAALEPWLIVPDGFCVACEVTSSRPIPTTFVEATGKEVFGERPLMTASSSDEAPPATPAMEPARLDLTGAVHVTAAHPPFLPRPVDLIQIGFARHYGNPEVELPAEGIVLGNAIVGGTEQEMRIAPDDRSRHVYAIGATGTGKSTLLLNMVLQDIERGAGVGLIDPHGDLFEQVLRNLPAAREKQVVLMDLSDLEHSVGLNFLECSGPHVAFQRGFVINELLKIFQRLYRTSPESMGPAFEQYMRNCLALLMFDPRRDATLVDIGRVFEDSGYRQYLKRHCDDPLVLGFWDGIAEVTTGDTALANWAPYITNKFNRFMFNPSIRAIVGQGKSTIDFRTIMDRGQIVLINLCKGVLGEIDTEFLGMLIMGKLFGAAMGRATQPARQRRPFYLYVDEFQNFTTDTVSSMLAEARKYGLSLTLANQNMAQLEGRLLESVMANVGTKLFFRIGGSDASIVDQYVRPQLRGEDLLTLADHHAAGRLLAGNIPTPAIVFGTRAAQPPRGGVGAASARVEAIRRHSRQKFARPVREVEEEIAARRNAFRREED